MFDTYKKAGIVMLASMIIGFDWHDDKTLEDDFQYLLSMQPSLSQIMIYSPCPQTPLYQRFKDENRLLDIPYIKRDGFHVMFRHPYFSPEKLEKLLMEFFSREYEELGPSIFRIQQVQLMGYDYLKDTGNPLFRARRNEHRRLCLDIYPLLNTGIRFAPSVKVRSKLIGLKEQVEDTFKISNALKFKEKAVPLLYYYTHLKGKLMSKPIVKSEIKRFNI
jgi:hypothetical protein